MNKFKPHDRKSQFEKYCLEIFFAENGRL